MDDLTIAVFSFPGHADLLPYVLSSVKKYAPPHREICLIWDDTMRDQPQIDFSLLQKQSGCFFRLIKHSEIHPWSESIQKWGWIKQQLVKLKCHLYTSSRYTWIVDGDVCLVGDPDLFDKSGHPYLRYHAQPTHSAYLDFITKYLKIDQFYPYDFVGSTALFENSICVEIDEHIKKTTGLNLIDCVEHCISDPGHDPWPFSEFQTYGTYIYNNYRQNYLLEERNWNYGPYESLWAMPIQIMWNSIAEINHLDYPAKIQWLTNKHHSAKIVEC